RPGGFTGDPFRFSRGRGNFAVERHGRLDRDERCAADNPVIERFVKTIHFLREHPGDNLNARPLQDAEPAPGVRRVRVGRRDYNPRDARVDEGIRAWWGPAMSGTRLQRHIKGCAPWVVAPTDGVAQRFDFGVRSSRALVPPLPYHLVAPDKQ